MRTQHLAPILSSLWALTSCTLLPVSVGEPPDFEAPQQVLERGPHPNWPIPPDESPDFLDPDRIHPLSVKRAGAGLTGAEKVWMRKDGREHPVPAKWKTMLPPRWVDHLPFVPGMLDGVNNSPRKEIAAWRIQRLFLDPQDYVVPPSIAHCAPMEQVVPFVPSAKPTLEGSRCELGVLSLWLKNVTLPDPLLDDERFARDPVYAYYLADFNLLTYLIKHNDGREGNFLVSKDDSRRQVFAIDNGVAFGGIWYNWFVPNWSKLRVPALRRASIDRLRELREEDLHALLGVVAELRLDDEGQFFAVEPGPNLEDDEGVRYEDGVLQFGLTEDEIEDIAERIEDLIEDVDEGDVAVF